ncbi:SET and MYND domain-containing protein 4-like protein [Leptotrombidium deliense]|uniref:SET and MYND domain-containing protein 4-like protein n=1 Tax=Leptotrombidium deliense TaxID=299467 RepID=A0A443SFP1_9ACAR|nr:SET and MYND domain-containing protein 4-like protein [Leptotrombidium deliense]
MALRLALVYGLPDSQETETREKDAARFGNNRSSVLSLVSAFNFCDSNFRMLIAVASIILAKLADKMALIYFKPDKFLSTAAFMCNYIYKVIANCYYIYDEKVSRTNYWNIISTCSETFEIGIGLYTTASLFAHSCEANAYRFCVGNKIVLLSSVDIESGEEVCIDYGIKYVDTCRSDRIFYLKHTFGFICKCKACENDWENMSHALICPKCDGALILTENTHSNYCLTCNAKDVDIIRSASYIQRSIESANNAKFYFRIGHYRKALKYFEKLLYQNSQGYYYGRFDLDLILKIARCATKTGEMEKAGEMYLKSLLLHKVMFGEESLEFINRLFEFNEFLNGYERHSDDETIDCKANYENAILLLKNTINREVLSATESRLKFLKRIRPNAPFAIANIFKSINE